MSESIPTYEAVVIGGGISGMYVTYRLRELGMNFRVFEAPSDVGGTWYWCLNQGVQFDSESWFYGFLKNCSKSGTGRSISLRSPTRSNI